MDGWYLRLSPRTKAMLGDKPMIQQVKDTFLIVNKKQCFALFTNALP